MGCDGALHCSYTPLSCWVSVRYVGPRIKTDSLVTNESIVTFESIATNYTALATLACESHRARAVRLMGTGATVGVGACLANGASPQHRLQPLLYPHPLSSQKYSIVNERHPPINNHVKNIASIYLEYVILLASPKSTVEGAGGGRAAGSLTVMSSTWSEYVRVITSKSVFFEFTDMHSFSFLQDAWRWMWGGRGVCGWGGVGG